MALAGLFDRQIQFKRCIFVDDGVQNVPTWQNYGGKIWAKKTDLSDAEKFNAGGVEASITTRFNVRYSSFTRSITPKDKIECEGVLYNILGVHEGKGRRRILEFSAAAYNYVAGGEDVGTS